jgi:tRNA 2-thiouridine synthesizing protein A
MLNMTVEQSISLKCKPQQNTMQSATLSAVQSWLMRHDVPDYHRAIDISNETCPMTFVRTRLALDAMAPGEILLVRLKGADPIANVPRAAADQGHDPLDLLMQPDGTAILVLRKEA